MGHDSTYRHFYESVDREAVYSRFCRAEDHPGYKELSGFLACYSNEYSTCLEIGSSKGIFQDVVKDYTGIDVVGTLGVHYHKPYFTIDSDGRYPLPGNTFDIAWAIWVHEHVPDLDLSMSELHRVLKSGGFVFFAPAWYCAPWLSGGYPVRSYSEFNWKGKLIKAIIPLRQSRLWRWGFLALKRFYRQVLYHLGFKSGKMLYRHLNPNYHNFWMDDSDACNSLDPHDVILWADCHGFRCVSHPLPLKAFFVGNGALILQKS